MEEKPKHPWLWQPFHQRPWFWNPFHPRTIIVSIVSVVVVFVVGFTIVGLIRLR